MLLKELSQQINERYEGSHEWDADMDKIEAHLKAILAIMDSANWTDHMDTTETNFDVEEIGGEGLRAIHDKLYDSVEAAIDAHKDLYNAMEQAA